MLPCEPLYGIGLTLAEEGSNREQRHYEVLDLPDASSCCDKNYNECDNAFTKKGNRLEVRLVQKSNFIHVKSKRQRPNGPFIVTPVYHC